MRARRASRGSCLRRSCGRGRPGRGWWRVGRSRCGGARRSVGGCRRGRGGGGRGLPGAAGDWCGAAEAREGGGSRKRRTSPAWAISWRRCRSAAEQVGDGVVVLGEQGGDLRLEVGDAPVVVQDVAGEFADATRGGKMTRPSPRKTTDTPQTARRPRWRSRRTDRGLTNRVQLRPVRPAVAGSLRWWVLHEAAALQLEHAEHADHLGLTRPSSACCSERRRRSPTTWTKKLAWPAVRHACTSALCAATSSATAGLIPRATH